jgi:hypothetical protein
MTWLKPAPRAAVGGVYSASWHFGNGLPSARGVLVARAICFFTARNDDDRQVLNRAESQEQQVRSGQQPKIRIGVRLSIINRKEELACLLR